ncbi:MAG: hypothetical protein CMC81_07555 [Flavobacteriaceae bacterium]|nr:hypothetical protein [Flavobacteriaceae bacterium]|tara:strand:+ start:7080 stop:8003 length:924 start_codon:yes stop_codon:yes gene_type:complete
MLYLRIIFFFLFIQISKAQKVKVIIDADTANEVDDLFAILGALTEPKFDVVGLTTSQFNTSPYATNNTPLESKIINDSIISLIGYESIPSLMGQIDPISNLDSITSSDASNFIVKKAKLTSKNNPLNIIVLGSCTNIASAIITDPSILDKIKVYYLGFWHNPIINSYNLNEFNTRNDPIAVNFLLNNPDLDLTVMSASTSKNLVFNKVDVFSKLAKLDNLGLYLIDRWISFNRWWTNDDKENNFWVMWDVALVEAIANQDISTKETFDTPDGYTKRKINIYTKIDPETIKQRYWKKIERYTNNLSNE